MKYKIFFCINTLLICFAAKGMQTSSKASTSSSTISYHVTSVAQPTTERFPWAYLPVDLQKCVVEQCEYKTLFCLLGVNKKLQQQAHKRLTVLLDQADSFVPKCNKGEFEKMRTTLKHLESWQTNHLKYLPCHASCWTWWGCTLLSSAATLVALTKYLLTHPITMCGTLPATNVFECSTSPILAIFPIIGLVGLTSLEVTSWSFYAHNRYCRHRNYMPNPHGSGIQSIMRGIRLFCDYGKKKLASRQNTQEAFV